MRPEVDVVILAYNSGSILEKTLPRILETDYPAMKVIVVDNGSEDGTTDFIARGPYRDKVELIKLDKNYGCSGGLNRSIPHLRGKYVAFLNEDIIPEKDWLAKLVEVLESDKSVVATMSKLVSPKTGRVEAAGTTFDERTCSGNVSILPMTDIPYAGLGATLFRTAVVKRVPMEERYFLYWEDVDYSFRLKADGSRIRMCQESVLYHFHQGSVKRNFTKADIFRMSTRNKLLFFFGFYPAYKIALFSPLVFGRVLLAGMKNTLFTDRNCGIATVQGIAESFDLGWIRNKRKQTEGIMT